MKIELLSRVDFKNVLTVGKKPFLCGWKINFLLQCKHNVSHCIQQHNKKAGERDTKNNNNDNNM